MVGANDLIGNVLDRAISEIQASKLPLYTFAFYHDHESAAISVCADTEENSRQQLRASNAYSAPRFLSAVRDGDLDTASLWQANIGRSLSLGDYSMVNVARTDLGDVSVSGDFHLAMIRAVVERHDAIADLALDPDEVILVCSGPSDEVEYVWSLAGPGR